MAEIRVCSSDKVETEIINLKETLHTQQQLLQNLYFELEEEREASATAASEALSMILRLQGERATEKMEARQYKRMAEEKMHHAEESLGMFEELMYQKELEIASLEFQIQAYRCKLLSMGFSNPVIAEMRLNENPFLERNEAQFGDLGIYGTVRRNNSVPAIRCKDLYPKNVVVERGHEVLPAELYPREIHEDLKREFDVQNEEKHKFSEEFAVGGLNSYWKQIKKLDEKVEEFSYGKTIDRWIECDCVSSNQGFRSTIAACSSGRVCSSVNTGLLYEPIRRSKGTNLDHEGTFSCSDSQVEDPDNPLGSDASSILSTQAEATRNTTHSNSVHDIFEVPQNHENHKICGSQKQDREVILEGGKSRLEKPNSVPQKSVEYYFEDEAKRVKKVLLNSQHDNKLSKPSDGVTVDCHLPLVEPTVGVAPSQAEVQKLNKQMEKVKGKRIAKQKVFDGKEEALRLLREIHEKLDSIQSEIRSSRATKSPPVDDSSIVTVMEAMLLYSL